ncbi:MAG TPA: universal stress protein [Thermoanaerobaculia bacterium]|jgi:nucleotide-binding universal stress UspA family protein
MLRIHKILFPTDFSPASRAALDHALLWTELGDAELVLLHVLSPRTADPFNPAHHFPAPEEFEARLHQLADSEMALFVPKTEKPLRIRQVVRRAPAVERGILDFAESDDVDLIVLGTHGRRGPAHLLIGSTAAELLRRSERAVLVVPSRSQRKAGRLRRILAPTDFSASARHAIAHARELAASTGATLELFHVLPSLEVPLPMNPGSFGGGIVAELEPAARAALAELAAAAGAEVKVETEVWQGPAAATILNRAAETEADLIVLATHGHSGLDRLLLGSVTEKVARLSSCPVLVLPAHGWSLLPEA